MVTKTPVIYQYIPGTVGMALLCHTKNLFTENQEEHYSPPSKEFSKSVTVLNN